MKSGKTVLPFAAWLAALGMLFHGCGKTDASPAALKEHGGAPEPAEQKSFTLIDVRSEEEYREGHLKDALLMPHAQIGSMIGQVLPDKSSPIQLYCHSGYRAGLAEKTLKEMGYTDVSVLGGLQDAAAKLHREIVK